MMEKVSDRGRKWEIRSAVIGQAGFKLHADMVNWCYDNFKKHHYWENQTYMNDYISDIMIIVFRFKLKKDAVLFQLTWG